MKQTERPRLLLGVTVDFQLRYHAGLAEELVEDGWDVHVVCSPGPWLDRMQGRDRVFTHPLVMERDPNLFGDFWAFARWLRVLRLVRPTVTLIGTPKAALLGNAAAWCTRVPNRLYELHGLRLEGESGLTRKVLSVLERLTCAFATSVIAVGRSLADAAIAASVVSERRVVVLGAGSPNGVAVEALAKAAGDVASQAATRSALAIHPQDLVILYVGRIARDKGVGVLLLAAQELASAGRTVHVVALGAVEDPSVVVLANQLRTEKLSIHLTGEVPDIAPFLAVATVFCLPTRREGLPTVVLEAFSANLPVVSTRATGVTDLVHHERTGLLVDVDDSDGIAAAIERLLADKELTRRIVRDAHELAAAEYTTEIVQARYLKLLSTLRIRE